MDDSTQPPTPVRILLVSPDLMLTSRVAGLARDLPARVETLRSLEADPSGGPYDLVLLDTGSIQGDPAVMLTRIRAILGTSPTPIAAFGPHVHRDRLSQARDAGADHVVSRGELLGGFGPLVARWCRPA